MFSKTLIHSFEIACLARDLCHSSQRVAPFYHGSELCFQGLKQSDPINRSSVQRDDRILLNCLNTHLLEHMCTNVPPEVDFESSRSLNLFIV